MILDRLVLDNFKRFRHEEIHFKDGITGILGNNGISRGHGMGSAVADFIRAGNWNGLGEK